MRGQRGPKLIITMNHKNSNICWMNTSGSYIIQSLDCWKALRASVFSVIRDLMRSSAHGHESWIMPGRCSPIYLISQHPCAVVKCALRRRHIHDTRALATYMLPCIWPKCCFLKRDLINSILNALLKQQLLSFFLSFFYIQNMFWHHQTTFPLIFFSFFHSNFLKFHNEKYFEFLHV